VNNPPKILVVDDEPSLRELYEAELVHAGLSVVTATNGQEGVAAAKREQPDLILMDVSMPIMDGASAALALKNDPDTKDIKLVFLTSLSDPNPAEIGIDVNVAKQVGALDFIKKGLPTKEFILKVNQYIGR